MTTLDMTSQAASRLNRIDRLISDRPWIAYIDDERNIGNSLIVTLNDEYCFKDDPGCGVRAFDSWAEMKRETIRHRVYCTESAVN